MPANRHWTKEEKDILERHYPSIASSELAKAFQGRTHRAVTSMARQLGIRKSQERKDESCRENAQKRMLRLVEESRRGGRTPDSAA